MVPFPLLVFSALGKRRFKSPGETFFRRLLARAVSSALAGDLAAFLFAAAASSAIRCMSGLRLVRFLCKLEWICDYILSKGKPEWKNKGILMFPNTDVSVSFGLISQGRRNLSRPWRNVGTLELKWPLKICLVPHNSTPTSSNAKVEAGGSGL